MVCSWSAFFASSIAVSVLVILLYFLLQNNRLLSRFGVVCLYFCILLVLVRGCLSVDFCGKMYETPYGTMERTVHLTRSFYSARILPFWVDLLRQPLFSVCGISVTLRMILGTVWAAGAVVCLWRYVSGHLSLRKRLLELPRVEDGGTKAVYARVYEEIFPGKRDRCTVVESDLLGTAAVFGMRRPVIILPGVAYSSEELYFIFRHELLHVKHKDHLWKELCSLLAAVHWWNPVIFRLFPKVTAQAQELLVDHQITRALEPEERVCYLECIKKTAEHARMNRREEMSVHALGIRGGKRDVLQRFHLIIDPRCSGYTWKSMVISLVIFLLSFTFVFEPLRRPHYDEEGNEVFTLVRDNSYFIRNGTGYDLYLDGRYCHTYENREMIEPVFKDLPIYEEDEK